MRKVENGNYVKVHYTGKYENGDVFDSSEGCKPLEIHVGASEVISGFENALLGMIPNQKKRFVVAPCDAYGNRDEAMERSFQLSDFPADFCPEVGQVIVLQDPSHGHFPATVKTLEKDNVVLDLNHPLAGKTLVFDIEVLEINDAPTATSCGCGCSCS